MCRCRPDCEQEGRKMKIAKFGAALLFAGCSLALGPGAARAEDTLFQDLGGRDAIVKIASDTADNFLADERIKATFDNTNMEPMT